VDKRAECGRSTDLSIEGSRILLHDEDVEGIRSIEHEEFDIDVLLLGSDGKLLRIENVGLTELLNGGSESWLDGNCKCVEKELKQSSECSVWD